jgi:transcriptional regulator with XRE-family HTH domain
VLAELRNARGWTQEEAARAVRRSGLPWTPAHVAAFETGRREDMTTSELVLLSIAFGVSPTRWFQTKGRVRLGGRLTMRAADFCRVLEGQVLSGEAVAVIGKGVLKALEGEASGPPEPLRLVPSAAETHAGKRLGIGGVEVYELAHRLWGQGLDEQRDALLSEQGMSASSRTTYRGHVTRRLIEELRDALGGDAD